MSFWKIVGIIVASVLAVNLATMIIYGLVYIITILYTKPKKNRPIRTISVNPL